MLHAYALGSHILGLSLMLYSTPAFHKYKLAEARQTRADDRPPLTSDKCAADVQVREKEYLLELFCFHSRCLQEFISNREDVTIISLFSGTCQEKHQPPGLSHSTTTTFYTPQYCSLLLATLSQSSLSAFLPITALILLYSPYQSSCLEL